MRRSVHINSSSRLFFASSTFLHFFDNCVWNCAEITKYFIEELFRLFSVKVSVCFFFFTSVVLSISLLFSVSLSFLLFLFLPLSARSSIPLSISVPICLLIYNSLHISFSPSLTISLSLSRPLFLSISLSPSLTFFISFTTTLLYICKRTVGSSSFSSQEWKCGGSASMSWERHRYWVKRPG